MQTTLTDLLSDLRAVAAGRDYLRITTLDDNGEALLDLGWIEIINGRLAHITDAGLDVLFTTQHVLLQDAA